MERMQDQQHLENQSQEALSLPIEMAWPGKGNVHSTSSKNQPETSQNGAEIAVFGQFGEMPDEIRSTFRKNGFPKMVKHPKWR